MIGDDAVPSFRIRRRRLYACPEPKYVTYMYTTAF